MKRSPKTAIYTLVDMDPAIAIVRCAEGDRATFDSLAAMYLARDYYDLTEYMVAEPEWRWYRMNPAPHADYSWELGTANGPGRGNWMGALVKLVRRDRVPA